MAGPDKRPTQKKRSLRHVESMVMKTDQINRRSEALAKETRGLIADMRVDTAHKRTSGTGANYIAGGPDSTRKTGHRSK